MAVVIKSAQEIALMRKAGRIVAEVLAKLAEAAKPGVTTAQLNTIAERELSVRKAVPSFKGYRGFPASICASINEEVVHGIPGPRELRQGDIISLDIGAIYEGFQGDAAITVAVGAVEELGQQLMEATKGSLAAGIAAATRGGRLGDVSAAIQQHAESRGFSVVREYVGHGIGRVMHEDPQIPNFGVPGQGPLLRKGMTMALEPMVNIGGWKTKVAADGWTVVTADGSLSAHFEHTIAICDGGAEILTQL